MRFVAILAIIDVGCFFATWGMSYEKTDAVIAKLGVPASETVVADRKVYTWFTRNVTEGTEYKCQIRVIMNGDVVGSFDYDGNNGGCARYADMLSH